MKSRTMLPRISSDLRFWVYFCLLTISNIFLSFLPLSLVEKICVLFFGIGVSLAGLLFAKAAGDSPGTIFTWKMEVLGPVPGWFWVCLLGAAVFLRFWKIDSLFGWPTGDEGNMVFSALALSRKWNWTFFYGFGQSPPLLIWIDSLFFKVFKNPFFNLWFPPAIFSLLTLGIGVLAARQFFSSSLSLLCGSFLALSYWPLYLGRTFSPGILLPVWECFVFFYLGKALKDRPLLSLKSAVILGLTLGLGSLIFTPWPAMVLWVGAIVISRCTVSSRKVFPVLLVFSVSFLLSLSPFLAAVYYEHFGKHLHDLSFWNGSFDARRQIENALDYVCVLFWRAYLPEMDGVPTGGGFLNPLLSSFFFIGLTRFFRHPASKTSQSLLTAFFLFLLPGFLSAGGETFRIVQVLPLLLVVAAVGAQMVLTRFRPEKRWILLCAILALSGGFDATRLLFPYLNFQNNPAVFVEANRSLGRYEAYQNLKNRAAQEGTGFIFSEWDTTTDKSLALTTYAFNELESPQAPMGQVKWMAVLADGHYQPFLRKRFKLSWWRDLRGGSAREGLVLGIIPLDAQTRPVLEKWVKANRVFKDLNSEIDHVQDLDFFDQLTRKLEAEYPLVKGDPFLEACYWEKLAQVYYFYGGLYNRHLFALEQAVARGYPAAHLYYKLAELLRVEGRTEDAQKAFRKALESERLYRPVKMD